MTQIVPAILTKDIKDLKNKLAQIENKADWVQVDIMDNKFVPNTTITVKELIGIKTNLNLEAHLMVYNPQNLFNKCEQAGFKRVVFHFEAVENIDKTLDKMKKFNFERGIAINPDTKVDKVVPYLDKIDVVLIMSVNPGFEGQKFIESVLLKVKELKKISPKTKIAIDGGVNIKNIKKIADAEVDYIGANSAVWKGDIEKNLKQLRAKIK